MRNLAPDFGQYICEQGNQESTEGIDMNQASKTAKGPKPKNKVEIPDLKPKKDPKGGIIAVLIGTGPTTMPPPTTLPPPTTK